MIFSAPRGKEMLVELSQEASADVGGIRFIPDMNQMVHKAPKSVRTADAGVTTHPSSAASVGVCCVWLGCPRGFSGVPNHREDVRS
jgi:hypothetical protein